MIFITPDVSENLVVIFTKEDDDAIATAMLSENIGIELREDGKFIWRGLTLTWIQYLRVSNLYHYLQHVLI